MSILLPLFVQMTGLGMQDVLSIVRTAPVRYVTYSIAKRNGDRRFISQPARELKALQRILVSNVISELPVHPCATAYRPGVSIRENVQVHAANGPILKYDLKDFFPSIRSKDWTEYCLRRNLFQDRVDVDISKNILFHREKSSSVLKLAVGAPSSPALSNVLMYEFDETIVSLLEQDHVTYTRYADDMTFSAKRTGYLQGVDRALRATIKKVRSPSLVLNEEKTVLATPKYKRFVTGLVIANDGKVSIGRNRKRLIRSAMHHQSLGKLSLKRQAWLSGMVAFIYDVEPEFYVRLERKYSFEVMTELKKVGASYKR